MNHSINLSKVLITNIRTLKKNVNNDGAIVVMQTANKVYMKISIWEELTSLKKENNIIN